MAYVWQRWLADEFRAAGLKVVEVDGWENRGRPASTGNYDPRGPLTKHHTGVTSSASRPHPTLSVLITGRSDLPGPLIPYTTGYDGTVYVVAAGRCNHAGPIGKSGVLGMPKGYDGNALAMGDEVDTNGTQTLPEAQKRAMSIAAAVVLRHFDKGAEWEHRHADISGSGKWDLGQLTTAQVRALTADALKALDEEEDPMAQYEDQLNQIAADAKAARTDAAAARKASERAVEQTREFRGIEAERHQKTIAAIFAGLTPEQVADAKERIAAIKGDDDSGEAEAG